MSMAHDPKKGWKPLTNVSDWPEASKSEIPIQPEPEPEVVTQQMIECGIVALKGSWNRNRPDMVRYIYLAMRAAR